MGEWSLVQIGTFTYNINTCLQQNVLIFIISYTTALDKLKNCYQIYTMSKNNPFELLPKMSLTTKNVMYIRKIHINVFVS